MRKRNFKDRTLKKAYENALARGGSATDSDTTTRAFQLGYLHPDRKSMYVTGSIMYAYWAAGVDTAREHTRINKKELAELALIEARAKVRDAGARVDFLRRKKSLG